MRHKAVIVIFGLFIFIASIVHSDPRPLQPRPKIGLALSGGGARGLAHLGVLRWFEEHRIPVDYVAGTSMGGLIGGLFASGRSSAEMEEFICEMDWIDVLRAAPAYSELSFRRREDERTYPNNIELGWNKGIRFPGGMNGGHKVGLMLDRIAFPYSRIGSFEELPTPFRCVATDLLQMKEVVLKDGSFSSALRATMSIPGIFAPVKQDGLMLVDGGLLNNLPTDVVKEMGANVIIAVDLGVPETKEADLESFFGALGRSIDVMMQANVRRNLKLADITLQPELKEYGTFSFPFEKTIIDRGYKEAARQAERLSLLALDPASWEEYRLSRSNRRQQEQIQPAFVSVRGAVPQDEPSIERVLEAHLNQPLDLKALGESLTKIAGWGRYDAAGYTEQGQDQQLGLGVRLRPKSYGPPFLKPSIEINGAQIDDVKFTVAARLTSYNVLGTNSEWRTDLSFGFRDLASTEYYHPLGQTGLFLAPRVFISRNSQLLYSDGKRVGDYAINSQGFGFDLGYTTGVSHEIRVGYQLGHQRGRTRTGDESIPTFQGRASSLSVNWQFDRVNDAVVPTRGVRVQTRGQWFLSSPGSASQFPQAETRLFLARPVKPRLSAFFSARGGSAFGEEASPLQKFVLGGPLQLGSIGLQELRGNHYLYSSVGFIKLISESPGGFVEKISAIGAYELGDAFDHRANLNHDVSAGVLGRTRFGVLFFGGSLGEGGRGKVFFSLGTLF